MISVYLGNPGSGKTAMAVREIANAKTNRNIYSNIKTKRIKHNHLINAGMIVKKNIIKTIKKKNGNTEPVYDYKLNIDFWKQLPKPVDVILDEAHTIINSRRAMSKINIIATDWLALIRRVLGQSDSGFGRLILITQLNKRIDVIAREMATQYRWHKCHYLKTCKKCSYTWKENSDMPEPLWSCPACKSPYVKKHSHKIEVLHFANEKSFLAWQDMGVKSWHKHYLVNNIECYFPLYDTLQWDNMFNELV